jgi:ferritin-like metal-binding protein YciE
MHSLTFLWPVRNPVNRAAFRHRSHHNSQLGFQMAGLRSAEDILTTELKEIYSAERQLSRMLPRLSKKVSSDRLRDMLEQRREQSTMLMEQLDEALEEMEVSKGRVKNPAAEGLLDDATQHLEQIEDDKLIDPVLLSDIQKIEHYCIAAWGTARSLGRLLDEQKVVKAMEQVLDDGKRFDEELTKLAEQEINPQMLGDEEEGEDGDDGGGRRRSRGGQRSGSRRSR